MTTTEERRETGQGTRELVEMSWDPITRIIGSLGIYTKIDFNNQEVVECHYHPYPPTPWNASPRDSYGTPGPYEDAVQGMHIFEENGREDFKGIDIMRTVRSFDPCLPCGVHMYLGEGRTLRQVHSPQLGAV